MLIILQVKANIYTILAMYVSKFVIIKYYIKLKFLQIKDKMCLYKALFSYTIKNVTKKTNSF